MVKEDLEDVWVSDQPVTIVSQWILELVVEGMHDKILSAPAPVCSRVFQEFASGVTAFHDAKKLEKIHFPFPYTQLAGLCLAAHCLLTPFIISEWVNWVSSAFTLSLLIVMVYWALYLVAVEIEAPFRPGDAVGEFGARELQRELNVALATIVSKRMRKIPKLVDGCQMSATHLLKHTRAHVIDSLMPGLARAQGEKGSESGSMVLSTRRHGRNLLARMRYVTATRRRHSRDDILEQNEALQEEPDDDEALSDPSEDGSP
eukprot:2959570-Amphidinium_carterae.1